MRYERTCYFCGSKHYSFLAVLKHTIRFHRVR